MDYPNTNIRNDSRANMRERKVEGLANEASDMASDLVRQAQEKGKDLYNSAQAEAKNVGQAIHSKVDGTLSSVGSSLSSFGGTIREKGSFGDAVDSTVDSVANTVELTGDYLSKGIDTIGSDFAALVRKHPIASAAIGLSIGLFLGRSRHSNRGQ